VLNAYQNHGDKRQEVWNEIERLVLAMGLESFNNRSYTSIVNSFGKEDKGSKELWK